MPLLWQAPSRRLKGQEMLFHVAGMVLLSLRTATASAGDPETLQQLGQILAAPGGTVTIHCNLTKSYVIWYKLDQDQNLCKVSLEGRSSKVQGSLILHNLQQNDSGEYFCAALIAQKFRILHGTRLLVSGASRPHLSTLLPSPSEGARPNGSISMLCIASGADPAQNETFWNTGWKDVPMTDGSFKLIPSGRWTQAVPLDCSDRGERNTRQTGNLGKPATGRCVREIPETEYAELPCRK
ncbi:uncharacterized protein LOC123032851 isoform X2 [Varanus komodoensis]|uniref:uncharacterized protein LOC123032851 isoform X2 n=1 Tax=Varanus komodoensis TaxID=61221 RepID=UPI001CF79F24|nr:uncharacterized protein LOC123032851 isoform X2 [Varanus komodoensis]